MSITKHFGRGAVIAAAALALVPAAASAAAPGGPGPIGPGVPGGPTDIPGLNLPNTPPHAEFTANPNPALLGRLNGRPNTLPIIGARVALDASGSYDLGGSIAKYEWDLEGDGTYEIDGGTRATRTAQFTTAGTHTVGLRVTDNRGARRATTVNVIVHGAPIARLAASPGVALVGESVTFNGAGSTDDGSIAKYEYDLDNDGTYETDNGANPSLSRSYGNVGSRTVRLRVTDNYGATATTTKTVVVHRAPTASLSVAPNPAFAGEPVSFDGSGSSDDEPIAKYEFDLDGDRTFETNSGASPTATKTYATPGTITVRMRVTDTNGVTDTTTRSLTVGERPPVVRDTTGPSVAIKSSSVRASRAGLVPLKLTCPADEVGGCTGKAKLAGLGSVAFQLTRGQTAKVNVPLASKKLRRLKRLGSITTTATVKATDQAGNTGTASKQVKVSKPKRSRR
jgi:hypothetical protein